MKTQVIAHASLLLVGALLAYLAWNRPESSGKEQGVVLAALTQKDLEELSLTWPEGEVTVKPLGEGDDLSWAVTLTHEPTQRELPADEGDTDAGPDATEPTTEPTKARVTERFPGGRTVTRAVDGFAPLGARRSLGSVTDDRLASMGLVEPERRLVVKARGGRTWTFLVGDATYGDQGRYAKLEGRDEVLLLDASAVRGLEGSPARLMEGRLVTLPSEDVRAMTLESEGRRATFTHVDRDQPKRSHFVDEEAPERRSEEAAGLLSTLRGLRVTRYVDESALVGATSRATVTLTRTSGEPLVVTVYEVAGGSDFMVRAGPWLGEVPAARARNVLDDVSAALPAER